MNTTHTIFHIIIARGFKYFVFKQVIILMISEHLNNGHLKNEQLKSAVLSQRQEVNLLLVGLVLSLGLACLTILRSFYGS